MTQMKAAGNRSFGLAQPLPPALPEDPSLLGKARKYGAHSTPKWLDEDASTITIRPIGSDDEPLMVKFHQALSDKSLYQRFFQIAKFSYRTSHERLSKICSVDYDSEMALVVEHANGTTGEKRILAVGRLFKVPGNSAELALLVCDEYQGHGLGAELLRRLIKIAREKGLTSAEGCVLRENVQMRAMIEKWGGTLQPTADPSLLFARIKV